ncbi:CYFA0S03e04082g1_1 [Cyberlindnera fabianii]|uniref:Alpha-glucosides permease MPH3 n=1 Tax=Cyberlindnera fabianii TaxID=36022 RepID=A0A061API7_CYBFA|nr:Alpha-glucosides permease MPH3 [Cyberlindnera fabianii]CDR39500.1 CYFA0S03e04082g1_1 [Cyberlindnera fabianii]
MPEFVEDITKPNEVQHAKDITTKLTSSGSEINIADDALNDYVAKFIEMSSNAQDNDQKEKIMPLKQGLKTFPKAAFWSVVLSTALIMEGFDTSLLASLYNQDVFQKNYGEYYPDIDQWQIPAKWQLGLSMSSHVGGIFGLYAAGIAGEKWGYRRTLIVAMALTIVFVFIVFFSVNLEMLLVGELFCGCVWGAFQTLTVSYASEVCPVVLRVYLTTYVNACWVIGQLIAACVLRGTLNMTTIWAYRIPWALQWIWPIPIIIGIYLAPESPWWLVKKNKAKEARRSIRRLLTPNSDIPDVDILADAMLNKIQLTLKEEDQKVSNVSYLDCFTKKNFRRTRVASLIWVIQNITGSALMGYSTYFYTQAGLDKGMSFTFSIIQYALGLIGTILSWVLSQKLGRFDIFFGGLCINFVVLVCVGGLGFADSQGASWAIGSLLLVFTFVYDASIGPITYCAVAEIPSATMRAKTVGIARNMYNLAGIPVSIITPYMLNPTEWNWKAKTGLFWAGFCFVSLIYTWFEFPETKGRTFAELDMLFSNNVRARKFKTTQVQIFNTEEMLKKMDESEIKNLVDQTVEAENLTEKA